MQNKYLLIDTCSYLRLAQHIHPLLNVPIGPEEIMISPHKELEEEYIRKPALEPKFPWFNEKSFTENRKPKIRISKSGKIKMAELYPFFELQSIGLDPPPPSPVDLRCLILAHIKDNIQGVITDDRNMYFVAVEFDIEVYSSLRILKLMADNQMITIEKVRDITNKWKEINDLPKDFEKDYKTLFREAPFK